MNIVFFGTAGFSKIVAEHILQSKHKIVAIVTQPDKVNARNKKVVFSDLKVFAQENNIPLYQFEKLNRDGEDILKSLKADIFVTASYGQIIKQNILDIAPIINVHASLLPKYRGPAPIQWCLINGEKKTGVTIMKTELGIDCGDMFLKKELDILPEDTTDSLFNKLAILGGEAIVEFLDNYDFYIKKGEKQREEEMTYFPMINKEMSLIDFNKDANVIVNLIKGLSSSMTAYFIHKGMRFKVLFAEFVEDNSDNKEGTILSANSKTGLIIKTKTNAINIVLIQPEGKNIMKSKDYCNSGKFVVGDNITGE